MASYTTEAAAPERRAFAYLLAATDAVLLVLDLAAGPEHPAAVLGARLLLLVVLLGVPLLLPRAGRWARALVTVGGVLAAVSFGALAYGTGGSAGPYQQILPILPIIFLVAVPDVPAAALAIGVTGGVLGVGLLASEGVGSSRLALWTALHLFGTAYGAAGALLHLRVRRREHAARDRLAESEARRVQAERMTLLGRVVAGVAHEVNNPLAALSADLRWLEQAASGGAAGRDEVGEVAGEARAALERLRRIVLDLGTLAREGVESSTPMQLADVTDQAARLAAMRGIAIDTAGVPAGLLVEAPRDVLVQALGGIFITCGESASRRGGGLRVAAEAAQGQVTVTVDGSGRGALLHGDLLLVIARERLALVGGAVEAEHLEGGDRVLVRLPARAA